MGFENFIAINHNTSLIRNISRTTTMTRDQIIIGNKLRVLKFLYDTFTSYKIIHTV